VKMQKDLTTAGELIRARQDEKQALLDEFDAECKRFFFGKISQRAIMASVKKTNKELQRLNKAIRDTIRLAKRISNREINLVSAQAPISYKATLSGIVGGEKKKKRKKTAKKKRKTARKR